MKKAIIDIQESVQNAKQICITSHRNPDGDAVGSSLALYLFIKKINPQVQVVLPNKYPSFLQWLPHQDEIIFFDSNNKEAKKWIASSDLIFSLDYNDLTRVGDMQVALENSNATFVMIDHHQQPASFSKITLSQPEIGSTCEMIYEVLENWNKSLIDQPIATCIYTGIMTDTGSFRYPLTSSRTHQIIGSLIDHGADNSAIHQNTFDTNSYNKLQLLGTALANLRLVEKHQTAYISLSQSELDKHGFQKGDTEGFVNYGLSLNNVDFAVIFIENKEEGIIKISFRSKGDFDVNQYARKYFNGGGHKNAAGGRSELNMDETIQKFLTTLPNVK
ncbi:MAG: bifunctional oligoribonuclease/PAP phosphatase NrnA [Flavobacteriaceae bacterium]|nr:bifunctional oligoribonuclease/PAP phosphatase NrnA [Flavobacteriaceae bacterium]